MNLLLLFVVASSLHGQSGADEACSSDRDHIDLHSGQFLSDCDDASFCSRAVNGTCQPRRCRRDQFPFGYGDHSATTIPPLCGGGSYCPDQGSGCSSFLAVGQPCQTDRDEQCAPPPDWQDLASDYNLNGSLCLNSTCTYANATLGQPCILDVVTYSDGDAYSNTITRHNCQSPNLYCQPDLRQCIPTKAQGLSCTSDQECQSFNCGSVRICIEPAGTPARVETWQVALTGMSVISVMAAIVVMLTLVHKRLRLRRLREIREYYEEQMSLRRCLASLHTAAADRYLGEKGRYD